MGFETVPGLGFELGLLVECLRFRIRAQSLGFRACGLEFMSPKGTLKPRSQALRPKP